MIKHLSAEASTLSLAAASAHPNKMPFSGVLTHVDATSDSAPHGSGGKLVQLNRAAAEKALPTLLGMAVNLAPDMGRHSPTNVVGVIEAAAMNGTAIEVQGYVFAKNFPIEASRIKADHPRLGFSYEMDVSEVEALDANPLVITDCIFTGAAILMRDKGAYLNTSLAAQAEKGFTMDAETEAAIKDAVTAAIGPLAASIAEMKANPMTVAAASMLPKVEPHAAKLEAAADKMESDGIGGDPSTGHAKILRDMAGRMRADAAMGRMPSSYSPSFYAAAAPAVTAPDPAIKALTDQVEALNTKIVDLKAAKVDASPPPERKTRPAVPDAAMSILASKGLQVPFQDDDGISTAALSTAMQNAGIPLERQTVVKTSLLHAGHSLV